MNWFDKLIICSTKKTDVEKSASVCRRMCARPGELYGEYKKTDIPFREKMSAFTCCLSYSHNIAKVNNYF